MSELDNVRVRVYTGGDGAEPAQEGGGKACVGNEKALPFKEGGHGNGEAENGDQEALPFKEGGQADGKAENGVEKALPFKEGGHVDSEAKDGDQKALPVQEVIIRMPAIDVFNIPDSDDDSEGEFEEYCHESSGEDVKVRGNETPDFESEDDD
jgi:hypothetical protein